MASDQIVAELKIEVPTQGILEGLDSTIDAYPPVYAPAITNARIAGGKLSTRRSITLWKTLPGVGRVRMLANLYEAAGRRIRLAARGNGAAATLYDYVEGTDSEFHATSGGTGLGGAVEKRFIGTELNDQFYFLDRAGPLRKYQETPSSGNQVRTVALPAAPAAAPTVKKVTYDFLDSWNNNSGSAPFGWSVNDAAKFDIEDGTATVLSPMGGRTALLNTKTNPINSPISRTGVVTTASVQLAMWVQAGDVPNQIAFRFGQAGTPDFSENLSPPAKDDWYPFFVNIGLPSLGYVDFVVTKNAGAADTYVSGIAMPGRLQGAYRYRIAHYDPVLARESSLSPISNGGAPVDVSAVGTAFEKSTAAAFQKAVALTWASDSGTDASTTQVRIYRSGGVPALTKDARGLDVWLRVGTVGDVSTTLVGTPAASPTAHSTIEVASSAGFAAGDWIVLAKGVTGTNAEEILFVQSVPDATHLTVSRYPCTLDKRGLERAHTNAQTVQIAFVDNVGNEQVDTSTRIYPERQDAPSGCKWIARSPDGRLWLAGPSTHVYVSNRATPDRPLDYEVFPQNIDPSTRRDPNQGFDFQLGGDTTEEQITWFGFFLDRPFAFTEQRLYAINAMSQLDWGPYAVVPSLQVGCINGDTVEEMDGWLYWLTDGPRVMRWNGRNAPEEVSHLKVNERLEAAPTADWNQWLAIGHVRKDGHAYNLAFTPAAAADALVDPINMGGLWLYLDSRTLSGAHGAAIGTWTDRSGLAHTPTGVGSVRPTLLVTSSLSPNGQQLLRWDGVDDVLSYSGTMPSVVNGWTIYIYGNIRALANSQPWSDDTTLRPQLISSTLGKYGWRDTVGGSTIHRLTDFAAGFQILTYVFNPPAATGLCELFRNKISQGSAVWDFNPGTSGGFLVGNGTVASDADFGAFLLFTEAHTSDQRANVEAYIESVWGL